MPVKGLAGPDSLKDELVALLNHGQQPLIDVLRPSHQGVMCPEFALEVDRPRDTQAFDLIGQLKRHQKKRQRIVCLDFHGNRYPKVVGPFGEDNLVVFDANLPAIAAALSDAKFEQAIERKEVLLYSEERSQLL